MKFTMDTPEYRNSPEEKLSSPIKGSPQKVRYSPEKERYSPEKEKQHMIEMANDRLIKPPVPKFGKKKKAKKEEELPMQPPYNPEPVNIYTRP